MLGHREPAIMTFFDRITFDPRILGGRAAVRGMRMSVSQVVRLVACGMSRAEILREYPLLEEEDVAQALRYAAALVGGETPEPAPRGHGPQ